MQSMPELPSSRAKKHLQPSGQNKDLEKAFNMGKTGSSLCKRPMQTSDFTDSKVYGRLLITNAAAPPPQRISQH